MNSSYHRILVLGSFTKSLLAAASEMSVDFSWEQGEWPLSPEKDLSAFSAILVTGPPYAELSAEIELSSGRSLPLVVIFAESSPPHYRSLHDLGIDEFLVEPFSSDELEARLSRCIERANASEGHFKTGGRDVPGEQLEREVNARTSELRAVNEQLDNYASYVAHDLRAPVKSVHALCEIIRERLVGKIAEEDLDLVERVIRSTDKMNDLITHLLVYSRMNTAPVSFEPIRLNSIVEESLGKNSLLISTHRATIEVAEHLPTVKGAPLLLSQVVDNLVGNALKFHQTDRAPHIQIYAERIDGHVRLWVEDNGIGIDPKFHQRIFQPLQRLHGQDTYEGNGLGLTILGKAVERMHGTFGVESTPNVGSRFWVQLPAAAAQVPPQETVASPIGGSSIRPNQRLSDHHHTRSD